LKPVHGFEIQALALEKKIDYNRIEKGEQKQPTENYINNLRDGNIL